MNQIPSRNIVYVNIDDLNWLSKGKTKCIPCCLQLIEPYVLSQTVSTKHILEMHNSIETEKLRKNIDPKATKNICFLALPRKFINFDQ